MKGNLTIYISGPMRGYKNYNFPAFHYAEEDLEGDGWTVLSPASHDVSEGFDTETPEHKLTNEDMERWIRRDIDMVLEADCICLLEGWENSSGAKVELAIAQFAGKNIYQYTVGEGLIQYKKNEPAIAIKGDDVLLEAYKLTTGDRQNQYGSPDQDFARTATMWSALKGVSFTTEDVASFLICVKLSRNTHQGKRDNWVDIAGYARCGDLCRQEKEKRNA